MLSLIERSKKVLDAKCWSGAIVEDISGFLKNTNKDILMTKLNVYESKYLKSISIYLQLQIVNKEKKVKTCFSIQAPSWNIMEYLYINSHFQFCSFKVYDDRLIRMRHVFSKFVIRKNILFYIHILNPIQDRGRRGEDSLPVFPL